MTSSDARALCSRSSFKLGTLPLRLRRPSKLCSERLEDRALLAITVMNTNDSGPGSLRQAIEDANNMAGADTIEFAPGVTGTIALTTGELAITDDLTIDGPGASVLTISGNNASRVFSVSGSQTDATIAHVTIADGVGGLLADPFVVGGGIFNNGARLTVAHVQMVDNTSTGVVAVGAAITNLFGARLTVTHSEFTNNQAFGFYFAAGGAVLNDAASTMTINHSSFSGNLATVLFGGSSADIFQGVAVGGAVVNAGASDATILQSSFDGNSAIGGSFPGEPGGLAGGGAVLSSNNSLIAPPGASTLRVVQSEFTGNLARGGDGGDGGDGENGEPAGIGNGGAINNDFGAVATIIQSTFTNNQAIGGDDGAGGTGGDGGVGVFGDNLGQGGALFSAGSVFRVVQSTFTGNQAIGGHGGDGGAGGNGVAGANGVGGAISSAPSIFDPSLISVLDVTQSSFVGNQAIGGVGGSGGSGGAGGNGLGGAIHGEFGEVRVAGSTLLSNQAIAGAGGDGANGGNGEGGGLWNGPDSTVTLANTIVSENQAIGGPAGSGGSAGQCVGGGVFNTGTLNVKAKDLDLIFANIADSCNDLFDNGLCI